MDKQRDLARRVKILAYIEEDMVTFPEDKANLQKHKDYTLSKIKQLDEETWKELTNAA